MGNPFIKLSLSLLIFFFSFSFALSQSISDDFSPSVKGAPFIRSVSVLPDGKVLVSGDIDVVGNHAVNNLTLLNSDGSPNTDFSPASMGQEQFFNMVTSADGITIATRVLARDLVIMKPDGSLDQNFSLDESIVTPISYAFYEDKYVITALDDSSVLRVYMVNQDGTFTEGFKIAETTTRASGALVRVQDDGKILVFSQFDEYDGIAVNGAIRLNADGSLDNSFDIGLLETGLYPQVTDVSVLEDGTMILAGNFSSFGDTDTPSGIVKLNSDGSVNNDFNLLVAGNVSNRIIELEVQQDGKIIVAATDALFRLNSNGSIDNTFPISEFLLPGSSSNINLGIDTNDNIYIGGDLIGVIKDDENILALGVAFFNKDGEIIEAQSQVHAYAAVRDALVLPDGKIMVVGSFYAINDTPVYKLARLNADGSVDESFEARNDLIPNNNRLSVLERQNDGQILLGGSIRNAFGISSDLLIRIASDGTPDQSFTPNITSRSSGLGVIYISIDDTSGDITVGGDIRTVGGVTRDKLVKITSEGELINEFNSGNSLNLDDERINVLAIYATKEGKTLVGGSISNGPGFLYQLDADGNLDSDFNQLEDLELKVSAINQVGEKILFGGTTTTGGSITQPIPLVQTDLNGNLLDNVSVVVRGDSEVNDIGTILDIYPLDGDEILITGIFGDVNSAIRTGLVVIDLSGNLNNDFVFNRDKTGGGISKVVRLDEEHLFLLGSFNTINGKERRGMAKIKITNTAPRITGSVTALSVNEDTSLELKVQDLTVEDIDNETTEISIATVGAGDNYTVENNTITPTMDFNGMLVVPVQVSDGKDESPIFQVMIEVLPVNDAPVVTGTATELSTQEETAIVIGIVDLSITDVDNTFPGDFTLTLLTGDNYVIDGTTITPATDFNGNLTVGVVVNDGSADSEATNVTIVVTAVNDAPIISGQVETSIIDNETTLEILLSNLQVTDVDNNFPTDFTLTVADGNDYTLDGTSITPASGFIGNLSIPVTVNDGTDDSEAFNLTVEVRPVLGLETEDISGELTLSPNPAKDIIKINIENEIFEDVQITIRNSSGQEVFRGSFQKVSSFFEKEIRVSTYPSGIFIVETMQGSRYRNSKKIIKD